MIISTEEEIWIAHGKEQFGYDPEEFVRCFKFNPTGADEFLKELGTLLGKVSADHLAMEGSVRLFQAGEEADEAPALLPPGLDPSQENGGDRPVALATRQTSMAATRDKVKDLRLSLKRYRLQVGRQSSQLVHMLEQQRALLDKRVKRMEAMVAKAEEAVWTLNLYLGKDEKIIRLLKGATPPAETKIVIRQLVLYMDEECAYAAEKGGIDAHHLPDFDKWLMVPAHLNQVLPETRGVVAIKPRRSNKEYGDPLLNDAMNKENKKTYWLIRNGGNLYRIWTALDVGNVIVPKAEEFDKLMREDPFWSSFHREVEPPKPGSPQWMKAMKRVDARRRHYMRILLFLQGLIDRTKLLWPLPGERINIMKERVHAQYVDYVYDGEESRLLPTGKPGFREWQSEINGKLEVGHRIVGFFPWGSDENSRVSPRNAGRPDDLKLYTINKQDRRGSSFLFDREGTIWTRDRSSWQGRFVEHAPKRRASYELDGGDHFFLNFDLATVDEMEFYLQDRINRHCYAEMFPVLKTAIKMKQKEVEDEASFRLLLTGEIMKDLGVGREEADTTVAELVPWWKFKTRTHRALVSDDSKALRMIVGEARRRWENLHDKVDHAAALNRILATYSTAMLVAYKGDGVYIVFLPENDRNVFVSEIHWKDGETLDRRDWTVIDARLQSWLTLWESPRMINWPKNIRREKYLSDPEIQSLAPLALEKLKTYGDREGRSLVYITLTGRDRTVAAYLSDCDSKDGGPHTTHLDFVWNRSKSGVIELSSNRYEYIVRADEDPWNKDKRILWKHEARALALSAAQDAHMAESEESRDRNEEVSWLTHQVYQEQIRMKKENARKAYKAEYGDDDTFDEEHKSTRWEDDIRYSQRIRRAAYLVLEHGMNVAGWTVEKLFEEARKLGFRFDKKEDESSDLENEKRGLPLPMKFVLETRESSKEKDASDLDEESEEEPEVEDDDSLDSDDEEDSSDDD